MIGDARFTTTALLLVICPAALVTALRHIFDPGEISICPWIVAPAAMAKLDEPIEMAPCVWAVAGVKLLTPPQTFTIAPVILLGGMISLLPLKVRSRQRLAPGFRIGCPTMVTPGAIG